MARLLSKPVWSEGMYLGPHHFQAQGRCFEDSLNFITQSLWSDAYGFSILQIDDDQLRNGSLSIRSARGLFEDGLAFDLPASDAAIPSREFGSLFSPAADHLTIHLAIPADLPDGRNISLSDGPDFARYRAVDRVLPDETTGRDARTIKLGQKNLLLLAEAELTGRLRSLPIARALRDGAGRFEPDPSFVPPCLDLRASGFLTAMLRRLTEILEEKSTVLSLDVRPGGGGFQAGLSARQVDEFWFLHALNSNLSVLRHSLMSSHSHPRDLFREMLRLGGALCTFGLEVHPRSLPMYDHRDVGVCFAALDEHIRRHLEIMIPTRAIAIPLLKGESSLYLGEIKDERCIGPSRWILEVRARMGEADLIVRVPRLVKVCSARFVSKLVDRALPGMTLTHLTVPPAEIPSNVESQYFVIDRAGPCWEDLVKIRRIGIHVPAEIASPEMKLFVLLN